MTKQTKCLKIFKSYIYKIHVSVQNTLMVISIKLDKTQKTIRELKNISEELTDNKIWREKKMETMLKKIYERVNFVVCTIEFEFQKEKMEFKRGNM